MGVKLEALFPSWIRFVVGGRTELIVALDWTEFDADDHVTLCAYAVTRHGRATPLIWKTHQKSNLEGHRTQWEHNLVQSEGSRGRVGCANDRPCKSTRTSSTKLRSHWNRRPW